MQALFALVFLVTLLGVQPGQPVLADDPAIPTAAGDPATVAGPAEGMLAEEDRTRATPTITVSVTFLPEFNTLVGTPSAAQSYTVSGANLTEGINIGAPVGFQVSTDAAPWDTSLTLDGSGGTVSATTIYVRLNSISPGHYIGQISHASDGAETQYVDVEGTVSPLPVPTITVSVTSLPIFNTLVGTPSAAKSYTVSGDNLTHDINIDPPGGFEISFDEATWLGILTMFETDGTVAATTIYVRLKGEGTGSFYGDIAHLSQDAVTKNVDVIGIVSEPPVPTITVSTPSLPGFSTLVGTPSAAQSYTVSGENLESGIDISPPVGFEISTDEETWQSSLALNETDGNIAPTIIYVRLTGDATGTFSGNIAHAGGGADTKNVAVTGTISDPSAPTITVSTPSLPGFSTLVGTPSAAQSYAVSGENLESGIDISPPAGFEISTDEETWQSSLTLDETDGTVATTIIYVRLTGDAAGTFSGNIAHAGGGAATKNVAVTGTVAVEETPPTTIYLPLFIH